MLYAVLADIHANLESLRAVLEDADAQGATTIVSLGDVVGYHAQPNECIELLRQRRAVCIGGNHDAAAVRLRSPVHFGYVARAAVEWTACVLSPENRRWLAALPVMLRLEPHVLLVHASLHPAPNADVRLLTPEAIARSLGQLDVYQARIAFVGHMHRRLLCRRQAGGAEILSTSGNVSLAQGQFLVNPGSVGQPRDGTRLASYLLYDSASQLCRWRGIAYDVESCRVQAAQAGLLRRPPIASRLRYWLSDRTHDAVSVLRRRPTGS